MCTVKTDKFTLFVYCNFLVLPSTTVFSQNINKQNLNIADKLLQITAFSVGITILNKRIIWKDDIEFVTEFLCLLEHLVVIEVSAYKMNFITKKHFLVQDDILSHIYKDDKIQTEQRFLESLSTRRLVVIIHILNCYSFFYKDIKIILETGPSSGFSQRGCKEGCCSMCPGSPSKILVWELVQGVPRNMTEARRLESRLWYCILFYIYIYYLHIT